MRLERVLVRGAHGLDVLVVDLDDHERVRRGLQRPHHVFGGAAADVRERDRRVAFAGARAQARARRPARRGCGRRGAARAPPGCRCGRGCGCGAERPRQPARGLVVERGEHVVARDATAGARAGDGRRVEVVLGEQLAHDRRQHRRRSTVRRREPRARRGSARVQAREPARAPPARGVGLRRRRFATRCGRASPALRRRGCRRRRPAPRPRRAAGGGRGCGRGARRRRRASPTTASTAPTGTVSPSGTTI